MCFITWLLPGFSGNVHGWLCPCWRKFRWNSTEVRSHQFVVFLKLVISGHAFLSSCDIPATSRLTSLLLQFRSFSCPSSGNLCKHFVIWDKKKNFGCFLVKSTCILIGCECEFVCIDISKCSLPHVWNIVRAIRNLFQTEVSGALVHPSEIHQVNVCSVLCVREQLFGSLYALRVLNDQFNECEQYHL